MFAMLRALFLRIDAALTAMPSPARQAAALRRLHGPEGAAEQARQNLDFAVAYGAPGEEAYWQDVLLAIENRRGA